MAMDRQDMIEKARFGAAELTGFIPAGYGDWAISEDQMPAWYTARDVEGAKALMAEANVTELSFGIKCSRPEQVAMALVAQENWKELGVNAEVVQMEYGAYFGYTGMVMAFLLVYVGVRRYRDTEAGGRIGFWPAAKVGALIMLVATCCYVATWYGDYQVRKMRAAGASEAEVAATQAEMTQFAEMYKNPLVNIGFTFLEPMPVGLLAVLISAGLLSRPRRA